jgi:hypothetical protein
MAMLLGMLGFQLLFRVAFASLRTVPDLNLRMAGEWLGTRGSEATVHVNLTLCCECERNDSYRYRTFRVLSTCEAYAPP